MKRTLSIILALVMCLTLAACGKENNLSESTEASQSITEKNEVPVETEENEEIELYMNESTVIGDFEIMITYVRFVSSYSLNKAYNQSNGTLYRGNFLQIDYSIKNVSKTTKNLPMKCMTVDYDNGYIFEIYKSYKGVSRYTTGTENSEELAPLSNAVNCRAYFELPTEVNDSPKSLCARIKVSDGDGTAEAVFNMRPLNETQQEAYYQTAINLVDSATDYYNYYLATYLFEALGDYKDSETLEEKAYLYAYTYSGSCDKDFFAEHMAKFPVVGGDKLVTLFIGNWYYSGISSDYITLYENGKIDDGWGNNRTWRVVGDTWIMNNGKVDTVYEVRHIMDDAYLLVENGQPSSIMYKVE